MTKKFEVEAELTEVEGAEGSLAFDVSRDDLSYKFIPAVTHEEPKRDDDGNPVLDDEGKPVVITVTDSYARTETDEEAIRGFIARNLYVSFEATGLENVTAVIRYTIEGEVEFDAQDWGLMDEFDGMSVEDVDEDAIQQAIEDCIEGNIREEARNYADIYWNIARFDAE